MTALDYANERDHVVVRLVGVGCPTGEDIAWIPPETSLPFDLEDVEGEVRADGTFEATNMNDKTGPDGWQFRDWNGNVFYAITLSVDVKIWREQRDYLFGE